MKRYIVLGVALVMTASNVQAKAFEVISSGSRAFVPDGTGASSKASESKVVPRKGETSLVEGIGKKSIDTTCNKLPFKVQVISGSVNKVQKQGIQIKLKCVQIVSRKPPKMRSVSKEDTNANGVAALVLVPKPGGWLDKYSKSSFNALIGSVPKAKKDKSTYLKARHSCPLKDKVMTFFIKSDGKTIVPSCGDTPGGNTVTPGDVSGNGNYQGPGGYDAGGGQDNPYQAKTPEQIAREAGYGASAEDVANGQGPTNNGYQQQQPYGNPNNPDYLQKLQDYNNNGKGVIINSKDAPSEDISNEFDDFAGFDDEFSNEEGDYYPPSGEKATPPPTPFSEPESLQPSALPDYANYGNYPVNEDFGFLEDFVDYDTAVQDYGVENKDFFSFEVVEINKKYPNWESDFSAFGSFEELQASCTYARTNACAYESLTEDEYTLMSAIFANSNESWDLNFNTLPDTREQESQCSWYSCWWYGLANWWGDTNPVSGKYDQ